MRRERGGCDRTTAVVVVVGGARAAAAVGSHVPPGGRRRAGHGHAHPANAEPSAAAVTARARVPARRAQIDIGAARGIHYHAAARRAHAPLVQYIIYNARTYRYIYLRTRLQFYV